MSKINQSLFPIVAVTGAALSLAFMFFSNSKNVETSNQALE